MSRTGSLQEATPPLHTARSVNADVYLMELQCKALHTKSDRQIWPFGTISVRFRYAFVVQVASTNRHV
jgi:hypothetical protein